MARKAAKSTRRGQLARPSAKTQSSSTAGPRRPPQPAEGGELLDMSQAIEMLKTTRPTFYRWLRAGKLKGMKVGRQWRFYRHDLERFLKGQQPRVELPTDIGPLIRQLSRHLEGLGGKDPSPPDAEAVQRAVALMIAIAVRTSATDLHLEPYKTRAQVRQRIDGLLHKIAEFDLRLLPAIVEQIKRLAAMDVSQKALPQDGRISLSGEAFGGELDLRVCVLPAVMGEAATIRLLRPTEAVLSLDRIGYAPADLERLTRALHRPWGLIVIGGPTGSGKTTVLYACLAHLADATRKIMSVEDPVEYLLPGVIQTGVRESAGFTFARAVRALLRSAPNIIMIGELRNREALSLALQSGLTGHLVLTTLHTDSAAATLKRMVDMGEEPFVIAEATRLVGAQLLTRQLCPRCSVPEPPAEHLLQRAAELARIGGLDWEALPRSFRRPVGCEQCAQTGFRGRTILAELAEMTPQVASALRRGATVEQIERIAVSEGMTTIAADGIRRAAEGQTTLQEVFGLLGLEEMPRAGWGK